MRHPRAARDNHAKGYAPGATPSGGGVGTHGTIVVNGVSDHRNTHTPGGWGLHGLDVCSRAVQYTCVA